MGNPNSIDDAVSMQAGSTTKNPQQSYQEMPAKSPLQQAEDILANLPPGIPSYSYGDPVHQALRLRFQHLNKKGGYEF